MKRFVYCISICLIFAACRHDDVIFIPEKVVVDQPEYTSISGFYLLNEGNMGSNKCTLDFYNYATGVYTRNIYSEANPSVPKELGDVGNDIGIYGSRLYAVINCSNKVEVMDSKTCKRIGQIDIPNCRYIKFHKGYAYVTSYAGPVEVKPTYEQKGYVAKIDTATMREVSRCIVGFQPDMMEIVDNKLYVANSGGYMVPRYENTISVIDIASFTEIKRVPIAINLHRLRGDKYGHLWLTSRGDYYDENAKLFCYDVRKERITASMNISVTNMDLCGDSLYVVSAAWNQAQMAQTGTFVIINVKTREQVSDNFITDGTQADIKIPYGVRVNPLTRDIYVTDARNYVNPGYLHCYSKNGTRKWSVRTGDTPAHIAFLGEVEP